MGTLVSVSTTTAATSEDAGITWAAAPGHTAFPFQYTRGVAWNGRVFCVTMNGDKVATSPDGKTWTFQQLPVSAFWTDIVWNGTVFCMVSYSGGGDAHVAATSPDGIAWTLRYNTGFSTGIGGYGITYNGSVLCAVYGGGGVITSNDDGVTWVQHNFPSNISPAFKSIANNGSILCVFAYDANTHGMTSTDNGVTWTDTAGLPTGRTRIAANGTVFCLILGGVTFYTSTDGVTWTSRSVPVSDSWLDVLWVEQVGFCAIGASAVVTSPDGITWTQRSFVSSGYLGATGDINLAVAQTNSVAEANITYSAIADTSNGVLVGGADYIFWTYKEVESILATASSAANILFTFPLAASSANFTSSTAAPTIFWEAVVSSTVLVGSASDQRTMEATVTGAVVINGIVVSQASYHVSASSLAAIISSAQFVQDFWDGWAFNLNNKAASFYENFEFNSFAKIGAEYYGCNSAGIYLLGGDLDGAEQIDATITTGTSDLTAEAGGRVLFDGRSRKSVPYAYISARSPEVMKITCRVEGKEHTYLFRAGKNVVAPSRADLGKGVFGTFWQFELQNQNGADFEIDSLDVVPRSIDRRI